MLTWTISLSWNPFLVCFPVKIHFFFRDPDSMQLRSLTGCEYLVVCPGLAVRPEVILFHSLFWDSFQTHRLQVWAVGELWLSHHGQFSSSSHVRAGCVRNSPWRQNVMICFIYLFSCFVLFCLLCLSHTLTVLRVPCSEALDWIGV